eukprot:2907472-Alexandrium_andersonii.AAC.1
MSAWCLWTSRWRPGRGHRPPGTTGSDAFAAASTLGASSTAKSGASRRWSASGAWSGSTRSTPPSSRGP